MAIGKDMDGKVLSAAFEVPNELQVVNTWDDDSKEKNNHLSLSEIAYLAGFTDQSHFIKVFKAFTGKTPKAFK